ncbi:MAG: hypothetical protein QF752_09300 [Planctomycetota bacterium]|nr:hypothetical protein [Planctomycetota bacterium]
MIHALGIDLICGAGFVVAHLLDGTTHQLLAGLGLFIVSVSLSG